MQEKREKPIGDLFAELSQELRTLLQLEMELFRTESLEKLVQLGKDAAAVGAGGVLLFSGFLVLLAAAVLGVAEFMPAWTAALLVAVVLLIIGIVLVQKGRKDMTQMTMKPEQTTRSLKEAAKWAKTVRRT